MQIRNFWKIWSSCKHLQCYNFCRRWLLYQFPNHQTHPTLKSMTQLSRKCIKQVTVLLFMYKILLNREKLIFCLEKIDKFFLVKFQGLRAFFNLVIFYKKQNLQNYTVNLGIFEKLQKIKQISGYRPSSE